MTNENIILNARFDLLKNGKIKGTGRYIEVENEDGEKKKVEEPEEIHTYIGWKVLNRQVKKGEKAITTIDIWKYTSKKNEDDEEEKKMFLTKAFFFTEEQTEPIGM